nr:serine/threonine-protein kinase HT1-like [Tanacetum cinerariifolium]
MASDRRMWMVSSPTGTCYLAHKDTSKMKWLAKTNNQLIYIACKGDDACKRFNMMPPPEANPLNQFVLTSNLYETNKKIECLATCVVITEGKHNMSIIEGTYDKVKAVVKKVRIMDDSKGTDLKKKLRDACFHKNLVAFLDCESGNEYNYYAYEGGITLANHIRRHPYVEMGESSMKILTGLVQGVKYLHDQGLVHTNLNPWNILVKGSTTAKICGVHLLKDVVDVNPGLVDEKDLMKLVGTNAEVIDLLKKIRIVQLQTAQPRPSWHSKFMTLMNSMAKILKTNKKAGWKYNDCKISSLIRLARNKRSHSKETRAKVAITSNLIHGDYIVKDQELGTNDTEI